MFNIITTTQLQQKIGAITESIDKQTFIVTNHGQGKIVLLPYFDGCDELIDEYTTPEKRKSEHSEPPWSDKEVLSLNDYQNSYVMHPFTCGEENCREVLIATTNGWICSNTDCPYTQKWAHDWMVNDTWRRIKEIMNDFQKY